MRGYKIRWREVEGAENPKHRKRMQQLRRCLSTKEASLNVSTGRNSLSDIYINYMHRVHVYSSAFRKTIHCSKVQGSGVL